MKGGQLKIAYNFYGEYKLTPVKIPIERIKDHGFSILSSEEGTIFINVNHYGKEAQIGNLYVSDFSGNDYVLSLLHNYRSQDGNCDFEEIKGIEGVYLANHIENQDAEDILEMMAVSQSRDKLLNSKKFHNEMIKFKKTKISFDRGATWQSLQPPSIDSEGNSIQCSGDCSLHLRGYNDQNSNPIYSANSASGIIIGTGNIGLYLSQNQQEINTYLSRDGGHSWYEIRKSQYIYEIGDHGGLIVMASNQQPTNEAIYSWDEGLTWDSFTFNRNLLQVTNIVIEPTNMSNKFFIFGIEVSNQINQNKSQMPISTIISIDFQSLHQRICQGNWDPNREESDYEYWVPTWQTSDNCIFGRKYKYIRRKREAKCFNPEMNDEKSYTENCECTDYDYECDFGYIKEREKCVPISKKFYEETMSRLEQYQKPKECQAGQTYTIPSGYRRISGDTCMNGVQKGPIMMNCSEEYTPTQFGNQMLDDDDVDNLEQNSNDDDNDNNTNSQDMIIQKEYDIQNNNQQKESQQKVKNISSISIKEVDADKKVKQNQQYKENYNINQQSSKFSIKENLDSQQSASINQLIFKIIIICLLFVGIYYFRQQLQILANIIKAKIISIYEQSFKKNRKKGENYYSFLNKGNQKNQAFKSKYNNDMFGDIDEEEEENL